MLPDPTFWRGKRVLLTGHTGFKGAWAALWLQRLGAQVTGLALPPAEQGMFRFLGLDDLIVSRHVDLRDAAAVAGVVADCRPQLVLHMAAQAILRRGLASPVETFAVNTMGTLHLLDALRSAPGLEAVLIITTDKVYRNDGTGQACRESDPLGDEDPYAASKAAAELATAAMATCYLAPNGVAVATARAGNVIGGGDFAPDRLAPHAVRAALSGQPLPLRHPEAVRPWQHVLDCLSGYLGYLAALATGRRLPPALNFGPAPGASVTVADLAAAVLAALGSGAGWTHVPAPNSHEAHTLVLDSELARRTLGWRDRLNGDYLVAATVDWYRAWARGRDMRAFTEAQISDYEALP